MMGLPLHSRLPVIFQILRFGRPVSAPYFCHMSMGTEGPPAKRKQVIFSEMYLTTSKRSGINDTQGKI